MLMLIRNKTRFAQGWYLFKTSAQQDVDAVTNASSVLDSMSTLGRRKNPSLWACWHIWLLYQLGSFHQDSSMFEKWKGCGEFEKRERWNDLEKWSWGTRFLGRKLHSIRWQLQLILGSSNRSPQVAYCIIFLCLWFPFATTVLQRVN